MTVGRHSCMVSLVVCASGHVAQKLRLSREVLRFMYVEFEQEGLSYYSNLFLWMNTPEFTYVSCRIR